MDFAQKLKSPSYGQDKDGVSLTPVGPWRWLQGVRLTEVQELFDREWRRGEAGVALDLLGDRLLQQPVEEPHPHQSRVQIRRAVRDPSRGRRRRLAARRRRRRRRGFTSTWGSALAPAAARPPARPPRHLHKHRAAVRWPWPAARGFSSPA